MTSMGNHRDATRTKGRDNLVGRDRLGAKVNDGDIEVEGLGQTIGRRRLVAKGQDALLEPRGPKQVVFQDQDSHDLKGILNGVTQRLDGAPRTEPTMSQVRVLIADDDPIIRLDLKQILQNLGYIVCAEAGDGQTALTAARETQPDVCILDVKMPVMDGIEAANLIGDECLAPVILLTAYSDRELVDKAANAGVFAYLVKPFKPSDLTPAIEVAHSRFEQNRQLMSEISGLTERLEARKAVDRAKGILMAAENITEAEAYRRIQQQSMNMRKSMREVAEAIIVASSV